MKAENRLEAISSHLQTQSCFSSVPLAPPDPILHQNTLFKADTDPSKISVGVGAYRTEQGQPLVLNCVKKAKQTLLMDANADHEYLPMEGLKSFSDAACKLIFGEDSVVIKEKRVVGFQCISGTGSVRVAAEFLGRFRKGIAYVSNPTWGNHHGIFRDAGMEVKEYNYWNAEKRGLAWESFSETLQNAPNGSIFVLHACAHNPTGVDPTKEQWMKIARIMKEKQHFPVFDCAYQGFASGDLDQDAWSVRYFVSQGFELCVCQSFAKNLGLYGERVGNLAVVVNQPDLVPNIHSNLCKIVRAMYSTPPAFGAKIANLVLTNPSLSQEWRVELKQMADRIIQMRKMLFDELIRLGTPGTWNHIVDQIGMFSYTGLTVNQCRTLTKEHHIYLSENGRISIAGLNTRNIKRFAVAMDHVVRNIE